MKWPKLQRVAFIVFLVLLIGSFIFYSIFSDDFDLGQLRQHIKDFGLWAPLVFIIFYIVGTVFFPATPFMAVAGILFGFSYGFLYTIIGGLLSSIIAFEISRKLGKEKVENILEHKYFKHLGDYNKRLEEGAIWDLIILRTIPVMPFNVLNVLMGVSRINKKDYTIGTFLGLIPSNLLTVYFGEIISGIF
jgi:uncharacterized membrane protein YdjX (TVP38/TMEM64 family)